MWLMAWNAASVGRSSHIMMLIYSGATRAAETRARSRRLRPNGSTIVLTYHNSGGARPRTALAVGPTADGLVVVRIGTKVWVLAGMLNIHEQAAAVGRKYWPGDFAASRAGEKTADFAASCVGD